MRQRQRRLGPDRACGSCSAQAMLAVASVARRAPAKSLTRRPSTERRDRVPGGDVVERTDQACRRLQGPVGSGRRPGFTARCRSRAGRCALQGGRRGRRHVALGRSGCRGRGGGRRRVVARGPVGERARRTRCGGRCREVVAFGPVLPGGEGLDVEPLLADGGQHGVEEVDGVAVAELIVCVALVGDCVGVAFDGGGGSLAGAFEVVLGPLELLLGDVEVVRGSCAVAGVGRCRVDVGRRRGVGVLGRRGPRRGAGRLDRRRLLPPPRRSTVSALAAAAVAWVRRADRWASRVWASRRSRSGVGEDGLGTSRGSRSVASASALLACFRGVDWARVRRWVVAGMSARSVARMASRTSRASAMSSLSVIDADDVAFGAAGGGDVQAAAGGGR